MTKPGFDLTLGSNALKELGIVLELWTQEITLDDTSLPMRDFNKLKMRETIKRAWSMLNSIYQSMPKEPQSMLEATECLIQFLDAKYEEVCLRSVIKDDLNKHLSALEKALLLELLQEFEDLIDGTLVSGIVNQILLN